MCHRACGVLGPSAWIRSLRSESIPTSLCKSEATAPRKSMRGILNGQFDTPSNQSERYMMTDHPSKELANFKTRLAFTDIPLEVLDRTDNQYVDSQ